jgi:hypothetical protein
MTTELYFGLIAGWSLFGCAVALAVFAGRRKTSPVPAQDEEAERAMEICDAIRLLDRSGYRVELK